tara:strand:+ start:21224 stop:21367 length:144 start_codon:yes stop_codon:yes gene_type:complete
MLSAILSIQLNYSAMLLVKTTDTSEVALSQSSRTKVSFSQFSYAYGR